MRYVRFGQDSKPTAILFALLELAKYPRYQLLRGKIVREVAEKKLEGPAKRIFDFAMCPIVPSTDLLQAWNCDDSSFSRTIMRCFDANSAPMNHINTSIERLKRLYNFETVKYGEESEVTDQTQITVYWDQSPGGSVQLLYTKYDMDSFYVTTKCSHIHLKFALNTKAKELMDKSNKESEFRQKEFICKVADCRKIISDEVFIISQKNAVVDTHSAQVVKAVLTDTKHTIEECYQSLMRRKETACQYCRKREGLKICSGDCSICRECAAVACFTPYHLCCPVCGHRIKRDQITSVLNIAKTVNLKGTSDVVNCDQCRTDKPIEQYAKSIRVKHHCMVCNECFPTTVTDENGLLFCHICQLVVSKESIAGVDDKRLQAYLRESTSTTDTRGRAPSGPRPEMLTSIYSCDLCGKEKTFEKFKCYFRLSHNCLICDSCYRKTYSALTSDCCSICETQLSSVDKSVIDAIIRGDRKDFGFCHNCERERPTDSFAVARKLSHWWRCRVCNDCFEIAVKAGPLEKCLVCKSEYSLNDIQTVLSHYDMNEIEILDHPYKRKEFTGKFSVPIDLHEEEKAPRRSQKSDVKSYTVTCTHEKSAYNALKCPNNCLCTLCFFKYYLLTGQGTCPTCGQRAPVPFPFEIQCSSCLRHYTPENVYKEGEALAVCTKGCVLCLYCVKTDERSLKCSVCDAPVETQAKKSVIETKQGVLHYACFCEVEDQGLEKLPCKHRIHTICRALIYDCRICGFHVNPRPTAFTISSFLI